MKDKRQLMVCKREREALEKVLDLVYNDYFDVLKKAINEGEMEDITYVDLEIAAEIIADLVYLVGVDIHEYLERL